MTDAPETVREILHTHIALSSEGLERLTARTIAAASREIPAPEGRAGEVNTEMLAVLQRVSIMGAGSERPIYDVVRAVIARALSAPPPRSPEGEWQGPKWQHVKRGSIVTEIARGFAQVAHHPIEEMTAVVIYRHDADGHWWVRNAVEFDDGRFVPAAPLVAEPEKRAASCADDNWRGDPTPLVAEKETRP